MGEFVSIGGEGVKAWLSVIRDSPGKRANELAELIRKSVQFVEPMRRPSRRFRSGQVSGCAEEWRVFSEGSIDVVEDFSRRI